MRMKFGSATRPAQQLARRGVPEPYNADWRQRHLVLGTRRVARARRGRSIVPTPPDAIQSMRVMVPSPREGSGIFGRMYGPVLYP